MPVDRKDCKCVCHTKLGSDGLMHDAVCCDNLNGTLEWWKVKELIAEEVVKARIDELNHLQRVDDPYHEYVQERLAKLEAELKGEDELR